MCVSASLRCRWYSLRMAGFPHVFLRASFKMFLLALVPRIHVKIYNASWVFFLLINFFIFLVLGQETWSSQKVEERRKWSRRWGWCWGWGWRGRRWRIWAKLWWVIKLLIHVVKFSSLNFWIFHWISKFDR